jgi:hypothetical protein
MKKTLLELLKDELAGEDAPEGWYTIMQLMEKLGAKRTAIDNLVKRKQWKAKRFRAMSTDGKTLRMNHYYVGKL